MVNKFKVGDIVRFKKRYNNLKFLNIDMTQTFVVSDVRSKYITIAPNNERIGDFIYILNMEYFVKVKKWHNKNYDNIIDFLSGKKAILINDESDYILLLRYLEQINCRLWDILKDCYTDKNFQSFLHNKGHIVFLTGAFDGSLKYTLYTRSYIEKNQFRNYLTVEDVIQ